MYSIDILGLASRLCDGDPAVWHNPNVENCSTIEITRIREEVNNLATIIHSSNNFASALTVQPEDIRIITEALSANTDNDVTILPNDLENVISTVGDLIRLICS